MQAMTSSEVRSSLTAAYKILAFLQMDDLTYTHLSARVPGQDTYFIYPLGCLFSEVTPECLLTVSMEGEVLEGKETQYNKTGYVIHSAIYKARPDVNAIFHLHTTAAVAVSAQAQGLLPISQFSFHFYNRLSYHSYNALALDENKHGAEMAKDLGENFAMLLQNHGSLTCGSTIHQAFFYAYYLEQACKTQIAALMGTAVKDLIIPSPEVCEQAAQDMRAFEPDLGLRDWQALRRRFQV